MIILPSDIPKYAHTLGAKTLNLKKLLDLGLRVPPFVALSSDRVALLWRERQAGGRAEMDSLVQAIDSALSCSSYAVRSSALVEDTAMHSYAGQFLTRLQVDAEHLPEAILQVVQDAHRSLGGKLELFSIIIQEYVVPDFAGVTFTRNPHGSRDMVIEYHAGNGEAVVSGQVSPERLQFYWGEAGKVLPVAALPDMISEFQRIEQQLGHPQDIEWCVRGKDSYFLQTRPITTLSSADYRGFLYLDTLLPRTEKFMWEKTEISEIAARPTPFTRSLLRRIYGAQGPVSRIYGKFGIAYEPKDFLRIAGNELYVDREMEIQTLLPAYSYLRGENFRPRLARFHGLIRTMRNIFRINALPQETEHLFSAVREKLGHVPKPGDSLEKNIQYFLSQYDLIFEINLLAEKAIKRLQYMAEQSGLQTSQLLGGSWSVEIQAPGSAAWRGNSLEVADDSQFVSRLASQGAETDVLAAVPRWKQNTLKSLRDTAARCSRLREYGRWLTVQNVNLLRDGLLALAGERKFRRQENIFFFSVEEIVAGSIQERIGDERRVEYERCNALQLPSLLTSSVPRREASHQPVGVSPGSAQGKLVSVDKVDFISDGILYVKILSPDLVRYFPRIRGIVSERGGLLSHLAIMAREHGMPVIVNASLDALGLHFGDVVRMDADTGNIRKLP